jgi:hypothetical protein
MRTSREGDASTTAARCLAPVPRAHVFAYLIRPWSVSGTREPNAGIGMICDARMLPTLTIEQRRTTHWQHLGPEQTYPLAAPAAPIEQRSASRLDDRGAAVAAVSRTQVR